MSIGLEDVAKKHQVRWFRDTLAKSGKTMIK